MRHHDFVVPMKIAIPGIVALAIACSARTGAAENCVAEGEPVQWIADYCMLKMETDDEIAVSRCIQDEGKKAFPSECASKLHFKKRLCEAVIRSGTKPGTVEQCAQDPSFKGRVVQDGGVGG